MLANMMNILIDKRMKEDYPHALLPSGVLGQITRVQLGSVVHEYNLKILDETRNVDDRFPEIPQVQSDKGFEVGDIVALLLLYGQLDVYIIGKAVS